MLRFLVSIICCAVLSIAGLSVEVEGEVSGEWTVDSSPYIVVDSTWVPEGETLHINPGVRVLFYPDLGINVFGSIQAEGTDEDSIRFLAFEENQLWEGLKFWGEESEQFFSYCIGTGSERFFSLGRDVNLVIRNSIFEGGKVIGGIIRGRNGGNLVHIRNSILRNIDNDEVINLRNSRVEATNVEIYTDYSSAIWGELTCFFDNCIVRGGVNVRWASYSDCELVANTDNNGDYLREFKIIGNGAELDNCIVSGNVDMEFGNDQIIKNSIIEGNLIVTSSNGRIRYSDISGGRIQFDGNCEMQIVGCDFDTGERESIIINDGILAIFYSDIANEIICHEGTQVTFSRCYIVGRLYIGTDLELSLSNNTIIEPDSAYNSLITFHHPDQNADVQIFNNILYTSFDSTSLFDFLGHPDEYIPPFIEYNCVYGFDYILHMTDRNRNDGSRFPFELTESNIIEDPLFVSQNPLDPHLTWRSPCVDAGDPESDPDPDFTRSDMGAFYFDVNFVETENCLPGYQLFSAYPNPFNSQISLEFSLPVMGSLEMNVYSIDGKLVWSMNTGQLSAGQHTFNLSSSELGLKSSGLYLFSLKSKQINTSHKLLYLK